ncbi:MAG: hypothetical protein Q9159_002271 [Coniocarpon cinnabarinum]
MATVNCAYTGYINPPNVTPVLTQAQVWAGLERKVRRGQDFVPVIESTTVVEEKRSTKQEWPQLAPGTQIVVREAKFTDGNGPPAALMNNGIARETCLLHAPNRVDFLQDSGSLVMNIISRGSGGPEDLRMTYAFTWLHPELDPVKDKVAVDHLVEKNTVGAQTAVEKSIEAIREMVKKGNIADYDIVRK